jgi:hypothetical protein
MPDDRDDYVLLEHISDNLEQFWWLERWPGRFLARLVEVLPRMGSSPHPPQRMPNPQMTKTPARSLGSSEWAMTDSNCQPPD